MQQNDLRFLCTEILEGKELLKLDSTIDSRIPLPRRPATLSLPREAPEDCSSAFRWSRHV